MRPLILGVDPGFTGAVAVYDTRFPNALVRVLDFDTYTIGSRKLINPWTLDAVIGLYAPLVALAVIENVGGRGGEGADRIYDFGRGNGTAETVINLYLIPIFYVDPGVWKNLAGLGTDKRDSLTAARKLFPMSAHLFTRKKDHGRAEASLLARHGAERILPVCAR